ncbi:N-acetyltransferase [Polymorphobacter glacialis]|uniref:N-acetyltransferase n=1 Tax=Sandarakinorhabdus glacialis TaxID=1614636 RepID=A0A916ZMB5_9SPHN|nr:GNAT family N-acetyltransferase [Polymorphobacter glacialis]GGE04221.1 N-acetyltransferase [Polymorphobacter glacialis]
MKTFEAEKFYAVRMATMRNDLPTDFVWNLETARLWVRPIRVSDADAYHRVRGLMPFDPQNRSLDESRALVAAMVTRPAVDAEGWGQFAIIDKSDGSFVGDIGVNFDTPRVRQAEIGFALDPVRRSEGLAVEACTAMMAALFASGRARVTALTDARNLAAQRLLERLRFRREGHFVRSWQDGDEWFDEFCYARLRE